MILQRRYQGAEVRNDCEGTKRRLAKLQSNAWNAVVVSYEYQPWGP